MALKREFTFRVSKMIPRRYGHFGLTELCRWPQWMLECPLRREYDSRRQIRSVIVASLGDATQAVLIVLVVASKIALGNADGGAEGITY